MQSIDRKEPQLRRMSSIESINNRKQHAPNIAPLGEVSAEKIGRLFGQKTPEKNIKSDDKINELFKSLKGINSKLWMIEDEKRSYEKNSDFGEQFIKVSREIHFLNDDRSKIKLEINKYSGSSIREIKQYTSY